jgi:cytochrome P450
MLHDESVYDEPHAFRPSRFMGDVPQLDPYSLVFGFGRRRCPGAHFADAFMMLVAARVVALFDILPTPTCPLTPTFKPGIIA